MTLYYAGVSKFLEIHSGAFNAEPQGRRVNLGLWGKPERFSDACIGAEEL